MSAGAVVSVAFAAWLALAPGLWAQAPAPASTTSGLTVFAAVSLTDAFQELGRGLEREHPGLRVRFNYAGSQQLAVQLDQGARADLFASADRRWMTYAEGRGLVAGEPQLFARNRLVVIVPRSNPARIARLEDLSRCGVKLVVAAGAVPAGRYSREALRKLAKAPGFPPDYAGRVLANVVSEEENVRSVVAKVQLGEADAGMAYRSDVTRSAAPHLRVLDIPDEFNVLASYPVAVLEGAKNPDAAHAFVRLLLSPAGQRVLQRHGLLPR